MQPNGDKAPGLAQATGRYAVQEAANLLGTTVEGVRSRIKRGTLDSMRGDGKVYVLLGDSFAGAAQASDQATDQATGRAQAHPEAAALLAAKDETIAELRDQVAYLSGNSWATSAKLTGRTGASSRASSNASPSCRPRPRQSRETATRRPPRSREGQRPPPGRWRRVSGGPRAALVAVSVLIRAMNTRRKKGAD